MRKSIYILFLVSFFYANSSAQDYSVNNNNNIVDNNIIITNQPVIERVHYIEKYRTIYIETPQPTRIARKLAAPECILGICVYVEDIAEFSSHEDALEILQRLNAQGACGRNDWRIPTSAELALMEQNADQLGLGDGIYLALSHRNGILRPVSTGPTISEQNTANNAAAEWKQHEYEQEQKRIARIEAYVSSQLDTMILCINKRLVRDAEIRLYNAADSIAYVSSDLLIARYAECMDSLSILKAKIYQEEQDAKKRAEQEERNARIKAQQDLISSGKALLVDQLVWASKNVGASSIHDKGDVCGLSYSPSGKWRLPSSRELRDFVNKATFSQKVINRILIKVYTYKGMVLLGGRYITSDGYYDVGTDDGLKGNIGYVRLVQEVEK